jgi:F-box protein, helicase, 18
MTQPMDNLPHNLPSPTPSHHDPLDGLTDEQRDVAETNLSPGDLLLVQAFAGTGKTTTLRAMANKMYAQNPHKKVLYVAFNNKVQKTAAASFPPNVECRTFDSLAFRSMGVKVEFSMSKIRDAIRMYLPHIRNPHLGLKILESWANRGEPQMGLKEPGEPAPPRHAIDDAKAMLNMMRKRTIPHTMSVCEKEYASKKPALAYDLVLVDESQDLNINMIRVLLHNVQTSIVAVGDQFQRIYMFKNCVNMLGRAGEFVASSGKPWKISQKHLTESFRFGPSVAKVATEITKMHVGRTTTKSDTAAMPEVKGLGFSEDPLPRGNPIEDMLDLTLLHSDVFCIFRTNCALLNFALRWSIQGKVIYFVGGFEPIRSRIVSLWVRWNSSPEEFSEQTKQYETQNIQSEDIGFRKFVEKYRDLLPGHMRTISNMCTEDRDSAQLCVGTVHKCKGLEAECVVLGNDFDVPTKTDNSEELRNLYFVAATRAKKTLWVNDNLQMVIGEKPAPDKKIVPTVTPSPERRRGGKRRFYKKTATKGSSATKAAKRKQTYEPQRATGGNGNPTVGAKRRKYE